MPRAIKRSALTTLVRLLHAMLLLTSLSCEQILEPPKMARDIAGTKGMGLSLRLLLHASFTHLQCLQRDACAYVLACTAADAQADVQ